jgi:hypothetical protein
MTSAFRIAVLLAVAALLGGAGYLGYYGAGSVSPDLQTKSVRAGSAGGVYVGGGGRIK